MSGKIGPYHFEPFRPSPAEVAWSQAVRRFLETAGCTTVEEYFTRACGIPARYFTAANGGYTNGDEGSKP